MSLAPGTRLGSYEVLALIGVGGMGEVYRATDTSLKRPVAIKVLPETLAADSDRLARFQREAEVLAALNHPNIAQIHGLERSGGTTALVMELVEGSTLADRIACAPIPVDEALPIAKQIAEALEAAHEQGIIHRDLKPANIKVREDGTVKVLDFGLAKAPQPTGASGDLANSPTITSPVMTQMGVLLGTAAYMAPEQARGRAVDRRADIWAFGCVLYEMVTGARLFEGEDLTETLASVVKQPVDLSAAPARVRRLLGRCLEKDPKKRLRDISVAWELLEEPVVPGHAATPRSRFGWAWWTMAGLCGAATAASVVLASLWLRTPVRDTLSAQFEIDPPGGTQFINANTGASLSPDGRYVVFVAGETGKAPLWLRPLDSVSSRPLPGTDAANFPFWSPDSRSVAFYQGGKLKRIDIVGGTPQELGDATLPPSAGGTWSRDGTILYASQGGLFGVASSGGVAKQVTVPDTARNEVEHGNPQFLPDGRHFLFFLRSNDENIRGIYAASLAQPTAPVMVLATSRKAFYVPSRDGHSGFLVWLREQTLLAQPFDVGTLRLEGDPAAVAEDVALGINPRAAFWTSDAGLLVYRTQGDDGVPTPLIWFNRQGKVIGTAASPENYGEVALSPDGSRVVAWRNDRIGADLWIIEFARGSSTRLTTEPDNESYPVWSPDGEQIVFAAETVSGDSRVFDLFQKPAGTTVQKELLWKDARNKASSDWSRDGRFLLYTTVRAGRESSDIWVIPMRDADRTPTKYLATDFNEAGGHFSPDGRWVVYNSDVSGRQEVYVSPFPDAAAAPAQMVSTEGGTQPRWRADGRAVFYLSPDSKLVEVEVAPGARLTLGVPKPLFDAPVKRPNELYARSWDVSPDGQRFLIDRNPDQPPPVPLTVVTNWQATLKK
ncbi:MAG: protein kinase domain-containing protein [Vicinamibacterales bacterium]